ncbi:hypothetical protein [Arthrobacter sp. NPDC057013]|uniref:hypothetical protein n=1 Tax=Arthrobacter sp. NPDC057013 TaxID=3345999 RepID=UPI003626188D
MARTTQAMHVARTNSRRVNKAGETVEYESVLLRRSFRQDGKVKHETRANLSALPALLGRAGRMRDLAFALVCRVPARSW